MHDNLKINPISYVLSPQFLIQSLLLFVQAVKIHASTLQKRNFFAKSLIVVTSSTVLHCHSATLQLIRKTESLMFSLFLV